MTKNVALLTTLYDPQRRIMSVAETHLEAIRALYCDAIVIVSPTMPDFDKDQLSRAGFAVFPLDNNDWLHVGRSRILAIEEASTPQATAGTHFHYCDFDRIVHWFRFWRHELNDVITIIPQHDFLILGRTARAWDTYPPQQTMPELIVILNRSLEFGRYIDLYAGSFALSRQAAEILTKSRLACFHGGEYEMVRALVHRRIHIATHLCEGLEWEDADYYQDKIAEFGSKERFMEWLRTTKSWQARIEVAWRDALTLLRFKKREMTVKSDIFDMIRDLVRLDVVPYYSTEVLE